MQNNQTALSTPVPEQSVVFGEVSLSGEVRAVAHADARLKEAAKLGFTGAIMPKRRGKATAGAAEGPRRGGLEIVEIDHLRDLLALFPPLAGERAAGGQGGQGGSHGARRREPVRHG